MIRPSQDPEVSKSNPRLLAEKRLAPLPLKLGEALRRSLAKGYTRSDLRADVLAGLVVGIVALPLSMALAVASGVAPQHGLYTAIVAGFVIALLGGSKVQVSGPTAAFVVILAPIAARHGLGGLLVATAMAGVVLIAMGVLRLGSLIQFVPYPVTTGFTTGIAVVIATLQLKDFFGLSVAKMPEHYVERAVALFRALPTARWPDVVIGAATLAILLLWPKVTRKVPAPLVALAVAGVAAVALTHYLPGFEVATIRSRFTYELGGIAHPGIPSQPPHFAWPWSWPGGDGQPFVLSLALLRELVPAAFAIALLGAIESLLSAVVADGLTGKTHDPDSELLAQGVGNLVAPFFGGIAATGAIARTATNVRSGARSPVAAMVHALFVLASMLALAPLLGYLPMAALAALLLLVAWNMSEVHHFARMIRQAPRSDTFVLLVCFLLTVLFDMVISVTFGVLLSAILFMKRMADVTQVELANSNGSPAASGLPDDVLIYEIGGPLFFGAAQKAMGALERVAPGVAVVILDLRAVPVLDATGLVALEAAIDRLDRMHVYVVLAGLRRQPMEALGRAGFPRRTEKLAVCRSIESAVETARRRSRQIP